MHDVDLGLYRTERVEMRGVCDAGNRIGIRAGTDFPAFVRIADELAIATSAQPDVVPRFSPIGGDRKALAARSNELDWSVEALGRESDQSGTWRHCALRTERPTNEGAHDFHLVGIRSEPPSDVVLQSVNKLARLTDRELIIHPRARGCEQLEWVVVLRRRGVFDVDCHFGATERSFDVADARQLPVHFRNFGGVVFRQARRPEGRAGRFGRVRHPDFAGRLARSLERIGYHNSDDLAGVSDLGTELLDRGRNATAARAEPNVFELARIVLRQDVEDARYRKCGIKSQSLDAASRDRARQQ